jgi:hypothetical protein
MSNRLESSSFILSNGGNELHRAKEQTARLTSDTLNASRHTRRLSQFLVLAAPVSAAVHLEFRHAAASLDLPVDLVARRLEDLGGKVCDHGLEPHSLIDQTMGPLPAKSERNDNPEALEMENVRSDP